MVQQGLSYDDDDFALRARKLITNGHMFSFKMAGEARKQLEPYLIDGRIEEAPKLGLKPRLQTLLAVLMLAEARGQAVSFEVGEHAIEVWVGVGRA